jgi:hypothetical protein
VNWFGRTLSIKHARSKPVARHLELSAELERPFDADALVVAGLACSATQKKTAKQAVFSR